ncbi:MAG: tyrosine-type recombinase/integrase [Clostridia bacterium]|nr:tyrosine-type recombinase/integrase [Clostridia bacterium]
MAVLTLKSNEIRLFPQIVQEFASYKAVIEGCSEKTVCEYLSDLRTFFRYLESQRLGISPDDKEAFTSIDISKIDISYIRDITSGHIYAFLLYAGDERQNGWAANSRDMCALRVFFKFLFAKKKLIDYNPCADIDSPRQHSTLPKVLTYEESVRLLQAVRNDNASKTVVRDYAIITLFLNCGMRLSELVGINLTDIDSELHSLRVVGKGSKERTVFLNNACRKALMDYILLRRREENLSIRTPALFLSNRHQRISNKTVQWMVYKYLALAGLDGRGFSVHKLRHTAATLMYQTGDVDIRVLKVILGHAQLNTTQIYTHINDENMVRAVAANPLANLKLKKSAPSSPDGDTEDGDSDKE